MNLTFESGNSEQRALWREGIENLLNLPLDAIPIIVVVKFISPASFDPTDQAATPFAETIWEYDSGEGEIEVRNDAPGFGKSDSGLIAEARGMDLNYDARLHFHETAAHETGHAVFTALPHEFRLKIAALFGADTDDPAVLQPPGREWKDRIGEAIAETFKEAFLPGVLRVFPNRTNIKLSYALYPTFRRLIREGLKAREVPGIEVPDYTDYHPYRKTMGVAAVEKFLDIVDPNDGLALDAEAATPPGEPFKFLFPLFGHVISKDRLSTDHYLDDDAGGLFSPFEIREEGIRSTYWAKSDTGEVVIDEEKVVSGLALTPGTRIDASFFLPSSRDFYREGGEHGDSYIESPGYHAYMPPVDERRVLEGEETPLWAEEEWGAVRPDRFTWVEAGALAQVFVLYWSPEFNAWVFWPGRDNINEWSAANLVYQWSDFGTPRGWSIGRYAGAEGMSFSTAFDNLLEEETESIGPVREWNVSSVVPLDAPTIDTCAGPRVKVRIMAEINLAKDLGAGLPYAWDYHNAVWPLLPTFSITEAGGDCGRGPVIIPGGVVEAFGQSGGSVLSRGRVQGHISA